MVEFYKKIYNGKIKIDENTQLTDNECGKTPIIDEYE
jgi:hypothetical protein